MRPAALGFVLLFGCGSAGPRPGSAPGATQPTPTRLPSLVLQRAEGGYLDLAEVRGQPTVVLLFTTYSLYAQALAAMLAHTWEARRDDGFAAIAVTAMPEQLSLVRAWRDFLEVPYPVVRGDETVAQGKSPLGPIEVVPMLLFVDREGNIVSRIARVETQETLDEAVDRLIDL